MDFPGVSDERKKDFAISKEVGYRESAEPDFSLDHFMDRYSTTDSFMFSREGSATDTGIARLSRAVASNQRLPQETCEGYLEKKSPNLFIKWQVISLLNAYCSV